MSDIQKAFYFDGDPIETDIGLCNFLTVREYKHFASHLVMMSYDKYALIELLEESNLPKKDIDIIEKHELKNIVFNFPQVLSSYVEVFKKVFQDENALNMINESNFYTYRNLVLEMNCISEDKRNPNKEVREWEKKARKAKEESSDNITFKEILVGVGAYCGFTPKQLNDFTVYQLYTYFYQVGNFKNYDTTTLFATVGSDVKIESWCKHIDIFNKNKNDGWLSENQFKGMMSSIFE